MGLEGGHAVTMEPFQSVMTMRLGLSRLLNLINLGCFTGNSSLTCSSDVRVR